MISASDIQNKYNKVYVQMRKYIWDFQAVEALADLEIECYKSCPSKSSIQAALDRLEYCVKPILLEDEDFEKALTAFQETLDSGDTFYKRLSSVREVVQE